MERATARQELAQLEVLLVANAPFTKQLPSGNRNFLVSLESLIARSHVPDLQLSPHGGTQRVNTCRCQALPPGVQACPGKVTLSRSEDGCGCISYEPHRCGSSYAFELASPERRTKVADSVKITRPANGYSRVSLPDGVIWSSAALNPPNTRVKEITTLGAKYRLLQRIRCNLLANRTVLLLVPMGQLRPVSGCINSELLGELHDVTGHDVVVLAEENRKRPAEGAAEGQSGDTTVAQAPGTQQAAALAPAAAPAPAPAPAAVAAATQAAHSSPEQAGEGSGGSAAPAPPKLGQGRRACVCRVRGTAIHGGRSATAFLLPSSIIVVTCWVWGRSVTCLRSACWPGLGQPAVQHLRTRTTCTQCPYTTSRMSGVSLALPRFSAHAVQVAEEAYVDSIRSALAQLDATKLWVPTDRHKAGGGPQKTHMVGEAYTQTDQMCMSPGYAAWRRSEDTSVMPGAATAMIAALAEAILDAAASKFPSLKDLRQRYVKPAAQAVLLGRSPFNLITRTENQGIELHLDTGDGPLSIILWLPHGEGELRGGHFCVPALGIKLLPLNCTMAVIAAGVVLHGTAQPERVGAGSNAAARIGVAAFLRTRDVRCLADLVAGAGGAKALQAEQRRWNDELGRCGGEAAKRAVRARAKAARDALFAQGQEAGVEALDEELWTAPEEDAPVVRKSLLDWVPC